MQCGDGDASIPALGLLPLPLPPFLQPCSPVFPPACPSFYLSASFRQPSPRGRLEYQDVREMYRKRSNKNKALAGGPARLQQQLSWRLLRSSAVCHPLPLQLDIKRLAYTSSLAPGRMLEGRLQL
ncbi:hypothetical protein E2C01_060932 [Portunus trituberculatus]|uniref:Uncharacterized protein n=1 Tax=Portunus trituberculatus TaxID=210409 RepID=A0A5B7HAE3_PORTR|nr:hypothetical protein [Portunus trituberculatus]